MNDVKFKLNVAGLNALMKSGAMQAILNRAANTMAGIAGDGFEVESAHPISFVAIASVRAATYKARRSNLKENTLEKARASTKV